MTPTDNPASSISGIRRIRLHLAFHGEIGPARLDELHCAADLQGASGCVVEPKFENEIMATRGSMSKRRAVSAVWMAISASTSASGRC